MKEALLLAALAVFLWSVLYLIAYSRRQAARTGTAALDGSGVTDMSFGAEHAHSSHSHTDCSAHSVDCGGHGGH